MRKLKCREIEQNIEIVCYGLSHQKCGNMDSKFCVCYPVTGLKEKVVSLGSGQTCWKEYLSKQFIYIKCDF